MIKCTDSIIKSSKLLNNFGMGTLWHSGNVIVTLVCSGNMVLYVGKRNCLFWGYGRRNPIRGT